MNKKVLLGLAIAFIMGLSVNYAFSEVPVGFKIAVIDVQKLVLSSSQIKSLKTEQETKNQELIKFVKTARADVAKTKDNTKKKALENRYNAQLQAMKKSMDDSYKKKLNEIDAGITKVIQKTAQDEGYNVVLAKGAVLYGGTDITSEIQKVIK